MNPLVLCGLCLRVSKLAQRLAVWPPPLACRDRVRCQRRSRQPVDAGGLAQSVAPRRRSARRAATGDGTPSVVTVRHVKQGSAVGARPDGKPTRQQRVAPRPAVLSAACHREGQAPVILFLDANLVGGVRPASKHDRILCARARDKQSWTATSRATAHSTADEMLHVTRLANQNIFLLELPHPLHLYYKRRSSSDTFRASRLQQFAGTDCRVVEKNE
jgi:hypothetical protein